MLNQLELVSATFYEQNKAADSALFEHLLIYIIFCCCLGVPTVLTAQAVDTVSPPEPLV